MKEITCQACGDIRRAQRLPKTTKLCVPCRILRDLRYVFERSKGGKIEAFQNTCIYCDKKFWAPSRSANICAKDHELINTHFPKINCNFCGKRRRGWAKNMHCCMFCFQDPKQWPKIIKALTIRQNKHAKANNLEPKEDE